MLTLFTAQYSLTAIGYLSKNNLISDLVSMLFDGLVFCHNFSAGLVRDGTGSDIKGSTGVGNRNSGISRWNSSVCHGGRTGEGEWRRVRHTSSIGTEWQSHLTSSNSDQSNQYYLK